MSDGIDRAAALAFARDNVRREARALENLVGQLDEGFIEVVEQVLACTGKVITTGSGTSGIIAERLAHLLQVSGTQAFYLPSQDALHGGMGAASPDDLVIAFSKGGRTAELTELVTRLEARGTRVIAVTEYPERPFGQAASRVVRVVTDPADADPGGWLAFGSTLVVGAWGDALAATLMALREVDWNDVLEVHPGGVVGEQRELPDTLRLGDPEAASDDPGGAA